MVEDRAEPRLAAEGHQKHEEEEAEKPPGSTAPPSLEEPEDRQRDRQDSHVGIGHGDVPLHPFPCPYDRHQRVEEGEHGGQRNHIAIIGNIGRKGGKPVGISCPFPEKSIQNGRPDGDRKDCHEEKRATDPTGTAWKTARIALVCTRVEENRKESHKAAASPVKATSVG